MRDDHRRVRLLRAIHLTQDVEIDCTACLDRVPVYVPKSCAN
jgi:hypothetical protein